ncbi:MAG: hypothetical protein OJJ21_06300 [Ferrovibrio sp.]|uniref:hypothetical protein n=1 Tax=Ferrovibrio sp. TaxID=1917215 RepID=UPI0026327306|nr:hypothetical protein [Ferrovibrio sp.]MCW0233193.1 hypothetical protein [Ferrovibrio sp.]
MRYQLRPAQGDILRAIFAFLFMTIVSGCAVTPGDQAMTAPGAACSIKDGEPLPENKVYRHLVVADDHGRLAYKEDMAARVNALLDEQWALGRRKLLIYVHGGLNSEKAIVEAGDLTKIVDAMAEDGHIPLFLLWRTGGLETWWEQTSRVRGGQRFERTIWDTPVYIATDLAQGVVRAPVTYLKQMGRVFDYYESSPEHGWKLAGEPGRYAEGKVGRRSNIIVHGNVDHEHPKLSEQASYALTFPGRVISSPFVDSLGTTAWENMLRRARTVIHQTAEFDPACVYEGSPLAEKLLAEPRGTGAFAELFVAIEKWNAGKAKEREQLQITLIGHSMGTIILGDVIRLFPGLSYRDIVYMGAATSIAEFSRSVVPYLRDHPDARFYNLMLHPQREAMELTAGGAVPSGSLLEWIDEMYEPPKTILDRTLGKWRNVRMTRAILPQDVSGQVVLKVFGQGPGEPLKHGAFNDAGNCFWNPGYWTVPEFKPEQTKLIEPWPKFDWEAWGRLRPRVITECFDTLGDEFMRKTPEQRAL